MGSADAELPSLNVIWQSDTPLFEMIRSFHPTSEGVPRIHYPEDRAKVDAALVASLGKRSLAGVE